MKTSRFARLAMSLLFIAMMVMQVGQGAQAAPAGKEPQVVSITVSAADQADALAFWTPNAMANAEPIPMPVDPGHYPGRTQATPAAPPAPGKPGFVAPGAADPSADSVDQKVFAADWMDTNTAAEDTISLDVPTYGTAQVFTSYVVNQWPAAQTIYPEKWVGRLYISGAPGTGYCSATAFKGNNFVTAAHCVYDLGSHKWYNKWVFTPAYRDGSAPYGSFASTKCWLLKQWQAQPSYTIKNATQYDVAVCHVGLSKAKKTLNVAVGFAGYMYDYGWDWDMHNLGYPWKGVDLKPLTDAGKYLRLCTAESFIPYNIDPNIGDVLGMGCNLGPGISGGPWMIGYAPNIETGWVDSVNSGIVIGESDLYGIRFTQYNILAICTDAGCTN